MQIKICGLFRDQDIDFVNEARPDFIGFVFAESKRQVTPVLAQYLRFRLINDIIPVGVFVNARIADITALYQNGVISIAQLHGDEDESYITALKRESAAKAASGNKPIPVIKTIKKVANKISTSADYLLIDSGNGSGKTFNWETLNEIHFTKPWFLAGGIDIKNIEKAMSHNAFAIDVSSGAETDGIKDRNKIIELVTAVRKGIKQ